jgi:hypothetical protein
MIAPVGADGKSLFGPNSRAKPGETAAFDHEHVNKHHQKAQIRSIARHGGVGKRHRCLKARPI